MQRKNKKILAVSLVSAVMLAAWAQGAAQADTALQTVLSAPSLQVENQILDRSALQAVYGVGAFEPLWLEQGAIGTRAQAVVKVLSEVGVHGLNAEDYHLSAIQQRMARAKAHSELVVLDMLLTDGLMRYASDVRVGRISPRQVKGEQFTKPQVLDPVALVLEAAKATDLSVFLANLPPHSPIYWGQVQALAKLQKMSDWASIPDGKKIEPGDMTARIMDVRRRLAASGELGEAAEAGEIYDTQLVKAVEAYQERHGMKPDGIIGRGTLAMLNVSRSQRIDQVIANMERQRWLPDNLGTKYVMVNVPGYHLVAVSNGHTDLEMKTITGRPSRPTPIFADKIRFVEFNPDWGVPSTIAKEDILPHLASNPYYALEHKNARVYNKDGEEVDPATINWSRSNIMSYRFRAPPGPRNPLGTVKFLFPNPFDVYLHDTSEPEKFAEYERDLSSGCMRVQNPAGLANWILSDRPGWSDAKRQEILASKRQTRLTLDTPVPVWITYRTAWLDEKGVPVFRADIYGHDAILTSALRVATENQRRLIASMARGNATQPAVDPLANAGDVEQAAP